MHYNQPSMQILAAATVRRLHRRLRRRRRHGRQGAHRGRRRVVMLEAGVEWDPVKDSKMFTWPYDSPRRGAADARAAVRRVRRGARRLDDRRRAVHDAPGDRRSTGSAPGCSAAARITGAGSRSGSARTTSGARASTASATTGRSPTTTSSRTTTRSTGSSASSASDEGLPNEPDGIFQPPPKPRCYELLIKKAADKLNDHLHSDRGCRSSRSRSTAARPATTAASAAAAARRTRTSRRRRCCSRRRWRPGG